MGRGRRRRRSIWRRWRRGREGGTGSKAAKQLSLSLAGKERRRRRVFVAAERLIAVKS